MKTKFIPFFLSSIAKMAPRGIPNIQPSVDPNIHAQKKHVYTHDMSKYRLQDIADDEKISDKQAFDRIIQSGEMKVLSGSGYMGRGDGVYTFPVCFEKHAYSTQTENVINFLLNEKQSGSVIFNTTHRIVSQSPGNHLMRSEFVWWTKGNVSSTTCHAINENNADMTR